MGATLQQWEDRIRGRLGEAGVLQQMPDANLELAIESALAHLGQDLARESIETFAGDGTTYEFVLPGWVDPGSRVLDVEYPAGDRDRNFLGRADWYVAAGTSTITLINDTPAATETLAVRYTTPGYPFPDDTAATDVVPDHLFPAVSALAASYAVHDRAVEFASKRSGTVAGVAVTREPDGLFEAARNLKKTYDEVVNGIEPSDDGDGAGTPALSITETTEVFPFSLFHRRLR